MDSVIKASVSYRFDDVLVDGDRFRVEKKGQPRKITPRAFDVLVYLVENRDRIIEKRELFEQIWKESFVTDNALTRAIKEIRQVIGDDADTPRYIETVPKRGYRFIADMREPEEVNVAASKTEPGPIDPVAPQAKPRSEAATETTTHLELGASRSAMSLTGGRTLVMIAVAVVLIAVLAIALRRSQTRLAPAMSAAKATQIPTWTGLEIPKLSPDGNSIAYSSDHDGAPEIYVKPLTPGAREIQVTSDGQSNFDPAWSPDAKLIAFRSENRGGIWIIPATGGTARKLSDFGASPAWSRDGSLIAFQSESTAMPPTTIWTMSSQGGEPTPITQAGNPVGGHSLPSWSPDGKRIAFIAYVGQSGGQLWSVAANGGELKLLAPEFSNPVYSPDGEYIYGGSGNQVGGTFALYGLRISPTTGEALGEPEVVRDTGLARIEGPLTISSDGRKIAYSAQTLTTSLMSLQVQPDSGEATSLPLALDPSTSFRKSKPEFSPDGRKIAFVEFRGGEQPKIWAMEADGRNVTQLTTGRDADFVTDWLPDNDTVVFSRNNTIRSVSVSTGREKLLLDLKQGIGWPRVSPDGKQIAFNSNKGETTNIWTVPVEGGTPHQVTPDTEQMGWPCWSPDGKLIALQMKRGANTYIALMPSAGGEITQLTFEPGLSWAHDFSPDGDKIAFAGQRDGIWNVYWISRSTKQQKQLTHYTSRNHYVRYPSWSPLGNQIVYEYAVTTGNIWLMELK